MNSFQNTITTPSNTSTLKPKGGTLEVHMFSVYILMCADGTLYTGIALDVEKRIKEHNSSELGAKYTRSRRPVRLIFSKEVGDQAAASREEYRVKQLSRDGKLALVKNKA